MVSRFRTLTEFDLASGLFVFISTTVLLRSAPQSLGKVFSLVDRIPRFRVHPPFHRESFNAPVIVGEAAASEIDVSSSV